MALHRYKAVNAEGRVVHGQIEAANVVDLELRLSHMGLDFVSGAPARRALQLRRRRGVPRRELIAFCFHLEQLQKVGIGMLEALADLRESTEHEGMRSVIGAVHESIQGGRTLSQALDEHPRVFSRVFCALVRAGETSGTLPQVLRELTDALKWEDELAAHTRSLVAYPAFAGVVLLGVAGVLIFVVVPELAHFLRAMGGDLPWQTRALIGIADILRALWPLLVLLPVVATLGLRIAYEYSGAVRYRSDRLKLQLPLVGPVLHKIILARLTSVFAMMYAAGIAVTEIVRQSEEAAGNAVMRDALRRAGTLINEGQNLSLAFQAAGLFPPLVQRMLKVGEATGALDNALANAAYFYHRDVRESITRAQAVIEPLLTVLLGLLLLTVAMSVLGPVFDMLGKLRI
ncbi:MAG: type II secretion system F family protein [Rhodocyclaceae bacterium]|nr:type II secretion system F family protein [Rhodocyclaceae bacterium]MBX3670636.1 type II secretion system F family protein [Rhodocyclaceae bacterium]